VIKKAPKIFLICLCIFGVAMFYRFYSLDKRGYFPGNDASSYACIAKTYRAGFDYVFRAKILRQDVGSINEYLYDKGGQFGTAAKDGFVPIALIGSFVFGNSPNAVIYTSAFFGTATVMLLFFVLSRHISLFLSFVLTLLFAVSPYHVGFSREGLTVTFSSFFLLAAVYLYNRFISTNSFKYLSLGGLALGFGFLCHYDIAPFIFVFFAYEVYYLLSGRSTVKRLTVICGYAFLPLLLMHLFTTAIKAYGVWQHIKMIDIFYPYFNELFRQLILVRNGVVEGGSDIHAGRFYYFSNLFYHEGAIVSLLFIIAVFFIIRRGIKANHGAGYCLVSLFTLPFIFFLGVRSVCDRHMLSFIPLGYLIIAYGLGDFTRYRKLFALAIVIAIILNAYRSLDYFNYRSNFQQAVSYMQRNKGAKHITSVLSLSRLYVGRKSAANHAQPPYSEILTESRKVVYQINPFSLTENKSLHRSGYNYLLLNIPPSVSNGLTDAAMDIQPEYSTDVMICNDRGDGYDPALLRDKKGKYLYRFNVYDLGKALNRMGS